MTISLSVCTGIFLLYAKLEENYGLARHAMAVYERATEGVLPEEQNEVRHNPAVLGTQDFSSKVPPLSCLFLKLYAC